ncbi:Sorting nexin mvp1 [Nowakowskiella sp. JEL0407]|nr:Sorting nexin mvp1 [Nowakowskiella sp. JEL0407]
MSETTKQLRNGLIGNSGFNGFKKFKSIADNITAGVAGVQAFAANITNQSNSEDQRSDADTKSTSSNNIENAPYPEYAQFYQQQYRQQVEEREYPTSDYDEDRESQISDKLERSTSNLDLNSSIIFQSAQQPELVLNPWDGGFDESSSQFLVDPTTSATSTLLSPKYSISQPPRTPRQSGLDVLINLPPITDSPPKHHHTHSRSSSSDFLSSPFAEPYAETYNPITISQSMSSHGPRFDAVDPWTGKPFGKSLSPPKKSDVLERRGTKKATTSAVDILLDKVGPTAESQWFANLDNIEVQIAPEKGGFIIKYINYLIQSSHHRSTVTRRYSDFLWLREILQKRYPYRIIPGLPPKQVGESEIGSGAGNALFLDRRRRGLSRFLYLVANHPVLRVDDIVVLFLTEKMELKRYLKVNDVKVSVEEEMLATPVSPGHDESLHTPPELDEKIEELKANMDTLLEHYRNLCLTIERFAKRTEGTARDLMQHSAVLNVLTDVPNCISDECFNCPMIDSGFNHLAHGFQNCSSTILEQQESLTDGIVESLKKHRDLLLAVRDLYGRWDKVIQGFNSDHLNKRIESNQQKYSNRTGKEQDKIAEQIAHDTNELHSQTLRIRFIRHCVWDELRFYHQHKAFISGAYQNFVAEQARFSTLLAEQWKLLSSRIYEMPTTGFL